MLAREEKTGPSVGQGVHKHTQHVGEGKKIQIQNMRQVPIQVHVAHYLRGGQVHTRRVLEAVRHAEEQVL